jgi:16S rRNA (adenine1518-N6/adenine1519-N6)-dimethyltransferase
MIVVRPKKNLGQHFLKDQNIARKIVDNLAVSPTIDVLEIGPGMGVLTRFLLQTNIRQLTLIEIDRESVSYLEEHFADEKIRLVQGDFLKQDIHKLFSGPFSIIGNFPYNISSQIFFRILDYHDKVEQVVGMIQKEVADRFCALPGSKTYGILSVLLQTYYHIDYLFTVSEQVFYPPPKVKSAVIRLRRNSRKNLDCDEELFRQIVKAAFNQRRKVLSNALKPLGLTITGSLARQRAEQLSVVQFIELTRSIQKIV